MSSLADMNTTSQRVVAPPSGARAGDVTSSLNGAVGSGGAHQAPRTLEQKRQAIATAEHLQRLGEQPDGLLAPKTAPTAQTKAAPRDLTSKLAIFFMWLIELQVFIEV